MIPHLLSHEPEIETPEQAQAVLDAQRRIEKAGPKLLAALKLVMAELRAATFDARCRPDCSHCDALKSARQAIKDAERKAGTP